MKTFEIVRTIADQVVDPRILDLLNRAERGEDIAEDAKLIHQEHSDPAIGVRGSDSDILYAIECAVQGEDYVTNVISYVTYVELSQRRDLHGTGSYYWDAWADRANEIARQWGVEEYADPIYHP